MKKIVIFLSIGFLVIFIALFFLVYRILPEMIPVLNKAPKDRQSQEKQAGASVINNFDTGASVQDLILIDSPDLSLPLEAEFVLAGSAPGEWFNDGVLMIHLLDNNGKKLATSYAAAEGIWTKDSIVNFKADFAYSPQKEKTGSLVFINASNNETYAVLAQFK
ncbi:MAG: hypothetical protein U9Q85_03495 [Patescibacteria group bacterium]|nr:hypothetical protein [Patescibacteria group bacterium]